MRESQQGLGMSSTTRRGARNTAKMGSGVPLPQKRLSSFNNLVRGGDATEEPLNSTKLPRMFSVDTY